MVTMRGHAIKKPSGEGNAYRAGKRVASIRPQLLSRIDMLPGASLAHGEQGKQHTDGQIFSASAGALGRTAQRIAIIFPASGK